MGMPLPMYETLPGCTLAPGALAPLVQCIRSIDQLEGTLHIISGLWLSPTLGCFALAGMTHMGCVICLACHFGRWEEGVPFERLVAVHFLVAEDGLFQGGKQKTSIILIKVWMRTDRIWTISCQQMMDGLRLISLHRKPCLYVLRSRVGLLIVYSRYCR